MTATPMPRPPASISPASPADLRFRQNTARQRRGCAVADKQTEANARAETHRDRADFNTTRSVARRRPDTTSTASGAVACSSPRDSDHTATVPGEPTTPPRTAAGYFPRDLPSARAGSRCTYKKSAPQRNRIPVGSVSSRFHVAPDPGDGLMPSVPCVWSSIRLEQHLKGGQSVVQASESGDRGYSRSGSVASAIAVGECRRVPGARGRLARGRGREI